MNEAGSSAPGCADVAVFAAFVDHDPVAGLQVRRIRSFFEDHAHVFVARHERVVALFGVLFPAVGLHVRAGRNRAPQRLGDHCVGTFRGQSDGTERRFKRPLDHHGGGSDQIHGKTSLLLTGEWLYYGYFTKRPYRMQARNGKKCEFFRLRSAQPFRIGVDTGEGAGVAVVGDPDVPRQAFAAFVAQQGGVETAVRLQLEAFLLPRGERKRERFRQRCRNSVHPELQRSRRLFRQEVHDPDRDRFAFAGLRSDGQQRSGIPHRDQHQAFAELRQRRRQHSFFTAERKFFERFADRVHYKEPPDFKRDIRFECNRMPLVRPPVGDAEENALRIAEAGEYSMQLGLRAA